MQKSLSVEQLEQLLLMSATGDDCLIEVLAAGWTGEEQMSLQIDGITVQTWDNVGGDNQTRDFESFTYLAEGPITADRLRIVFENDLFDVDNGIDRNLTVDSISIDGEVFETEDPSTFSTGTWLPEDGVVAGNRESEVLHANGYFEFADESAPPPPPPGDGSTINVIAFASEGTETMELRIDGAVVQTWNNVGTGTQTYTFQADTLVTADQIQVALVDAQWNPDAGIDENLLVDRIEIDGEVFETEDPSTFSTATWKAEDGITPGFRESEALNHTGYFQYADNTTPPPPPPGDGSSITVFAAGESGTEDFELQIDGVAVASWNNISPSPQGYSFTTSDTVTADQIRVAFVNAQYDPDNGIDENLIVDRIEVDGVVYQTEAESVFSTGTWLPADGIQPGFRLSEFLHDTGYFEYASDVAQSPGVVGLDGSVFSIDETAGSVEISILRSQGTDGTITVDYQTFAASASDGSDFTGVAGTAVFAPGQSVATVSIPILDDTTTEGSETFTFTIDNVGGGGSLLVPRTATVTIVDDEAGSGPLFTLDDFSNTSTLNLNGDAAVLSNRLQLTGDRNFEGGSAYLLQPLGIDADTSFSTQFSFQITGGTGGADGLAFVLQNSAQGSNALGAEGGAVGYGGVSQSIGIEFDTYDNGGRDPNDNHIDILRDGNLADELGSGTPGFDLNSGNVITAWVEYDAATDLLEVFVSENDTQPTAAIASTTIDLQEALGSQAFIGFSAATGGENNAHELLNWELSTNSQLLPAPPTPLSLVDQTVVTGLVQPTAVDWSPDGENLYISEQRGIVYVVRDGVRSEFIDFTDEVNGVRDRGLLDIAVHPDFESNPYVYLLYTYDPPEVFQNSGLAGEDGRGNRAGRLTRVTADASTNYTTFVAGSETTILGSNSTWNNFNAFVNSTGNFGEPPAGINPDGTNIQDFIASDSESHTVGAVEFGPDGALYVTIGDGTSYNRLDQRTVRVQDIDNLSGKVLRIDPITGDGLADNPFYNGDADANRSKVYQLGVRNSFRAAVDPVTGLVYTGDVGWGTWEEINVGGAGANFGWPYFEGGDNGNLIQPTYSSLTEAQAFYNSGAEVTAPLVALNHSASGINAIVMGDIYRGDAYPEEYYGDIFFNDLGQGIVRNVSLDENGNVTSVETFTTGAQIVVMIQQGPDGNLYYVDLNDGEVGRWVFQ